MTDPLFQFLELTTTENMNFLQKFTQSAIPTIQNVGNQKRKERNKDINKSNINKQINTQKSYKLKKSSQQDLT